MTTPSPGCRIEANALSKTFVMGESTVEVLKHASVTIEAGEAVAIVGPSGSGKSTLMHLMGLLDEPTGGQLLLDGVDVTHFNATRRAAFRNRRIGFVFQSHNLLAEHTALANVMIPARLAGASVAVATERADALLRVVGLGHRLHHKPGELSGGEQQRVAIARALVMAPGLVLADEPTGNLDPRTAGGVFDLLMQLNGQLGSTLAVVTHSMALAQQFPRRLTLVDGRIEEV